MLRNTKYIIFYIFYISFNLYESYVILNLKKFINETELKEEYSPEIFINNLFNKYYSLLNIGYPPQKTEIQFSLNDFSLSMKENICLTSNYYNKNKSLTISQTHEYDTSSSSKKIIIVNESIEFPVYNKSTNTLSYKSIPNFIFQYNKKEINESIEENNLDKEISAKACMIYGFKFYSEQGSLITKNLFYVLKKNDIIKYENFFYKFYSEEEKKINGFDVAIIIGEQPHEYDNKKYKEENYFKTKAVKMILEPGWIFEFKNYYFLSNGTRINFGTSATDNVVRGWLWLDLDIIIGIKDYYNGIKKDFFDKYSKECNTRVVFKRYNIFYCDKNFDTKNFPTVYFQSVDLNYTFELTHKDLFEIRGDLKYFLIVFDIESNYPWKFGKLFLQKYFFNFETDNKLIGFYNNLMSNEPIIDKSKKGSNIWLWFLWAFIVIVVGVGGFFIGNAIKKKNRKKRANELDDEDFEYTQKNKNEKDKGEYLYKENKENDPLGIN